MLVVDGTSSLQGEYSVFYKIRMGWNTRIVQSLSVIPRMMPSSGSLEALNMEARNGNAASHLGT